MSDRSSIEWTNSSWNPIRARRKDTGKVGWACVKVSPGCQRCYAETLNGRNLPECGTGLDYTVPALSLVDFVIDEKTLEQPLRWKRPRKIFVGSMTDLFGEFVPDAFIDRIFAVMALCPQHTFIVLTKRAKRMREYFRAAPWGQIEMVAEEICLEAKRSPVISAADMLSMNRIPLPNVWLGVSVEDQQRADERIPDLLATPAAVRWVSYEPALGPVDFWYPKTIYPDGPPRCCSGFECGCMGKPTEPPLIHGIDWIVVGGESGPGARPFNIAWARDTIRQCREAGVAVFVKQLGARPHSIHLNPNVTSQDDEIVTNYKLKNRKGGDMAEWAEDLRVRDFPEVQT